MDADRWQAIEQLFLQVVEASPAQGRKLLKEIGRNDPALGRDVESLLAAETDVEQHLAAAIDATLRQSSKTPAALHIERYELLEELGQGGMGTVYLARRSDQSFEQRMAIKVARHGVFHDDVRHRMRQERHILAALDHPHICKLLDGGTTEDGLPYFVMEHIEGEPIDLFCDRRGLAIEERLRLFLQVCRAVHHAHRQLVIHRDLKPSNILVTTDGTPKLLDFGIAKLLDTTVPDDGIAVTTPLVTRSGMRLLTPAYASPEQIRGTPLSTATDVYGLGVLLYRLLSGQLPYEVEGTSYGEMERIICQQQPALPSTVLAQDAATRQRAKRLQGDLDNIVAMALRKEPEQRYASVDQLADDIQRHLDGDMVRARPHTFVYRVSKLIRRNRTLVAALVLILLSLTTGLGLAIWQARVAAHERRQADAQRDIAEANLRLAEKEQARSTELTELIIDIFQVPDPSESRGESVTVREILDPAVEHIRSGLPRDSLDRADLLDVLGQVYGGLGLYGASESLLEEVLATRQSADALDPQVDLSLEVAASANQLGELRLRQDRHRDAEALFRHSLTLRRRTVGAMNLLVAESLINLGVALSGQRRFEEAEAFYTEALNIQRRLLPPDHEDFIETHSNTAANLWHQQKLQRAEDLFRRALTLALRHRGVDHPSTVDVMANLTTLLHSQGKLAQARPLAEDTLAARRQLLDDDHPSVAQSLNTLSVILYELGELEAAEPPQRDAIAIKTTKFGAAHRSTLSSQNNLAQLLVSLKRYDEARDLYTEIIRRRGESLGPDHPRLRRDLAYLAETHLLAGSWSQAEAIYRQALPPTDDPAIDEARQAIWSASLGATLMALERSPEAWPLLQRSQASLERLEDPAPWQQLRIRGTLVAYLLRSGQEAAARAQWSTLQPLVDSLAGQAEATRPPRERLALTYLRLLLSPIESPSWLDLPSP